jgi:hypothetical protein
LSGAERGPHGDFAPAGRAAGQEQVGDVAAGDEQHDADRGQEHEQPRAVVADELIAERYDHERQIDRIARELAAHAHRDRVQLGERLLARCAGPQPSVDVQEVLVVHRPLRRREGDRHPQLVAVGGEIERRGHDADDRVGRAVHAYCLPDDLRARAEAARPEPVAEDDDGFAAGTIFGGREGTADLRRGAEDIEVIGGDAGADNPLGRHAVRQVEARVLLGGQAREGPCRGGRVDIVADRDAAGRSLKRLGHEHQPLRIAERNRLQHDGVERAEDRCRPADAEGERQDGNGGEAAVLEQLPRRERQVLPQLCDVLSPFHVFISSMPERTKRGSHAPQIAESPLGFTSRRRRIESAFDVLARPHLEMEGDLLVDFVVEARLERPSREPARHSGAPSRSRRRSAPIRRFAPSVLSVRAA